MSLKMPPPEKKTLKIIRLLDIPIFQSLPCNAFQCIFCMIAKWFIAHLIPFMLQPAQILDLIFFLKGQSEQLAIDLCAHPPSFSTPPPGGFLAFSSPSYITSYSLATPYICDFIIMQSPKSSFELVPKTVLPLKLWNLEPGTTIMKTGDDLPLSLLLLHKTQFQPFPKGASLLLRKRVKNT